MSDVSRNSSVDPATFEALKDMVGAGFIDELVDTFLEEAPRMLADLREALPARDADRFRRAAHSLKSNGMTFGAMTLAAMSKVLELGGVDDSSGPALDALDAEYARVVAALEAIRHG